jgi:hypothetical protein
MDRASFRTGLDPTNALVVRVIDGLRAPQAIRTVIAWLRLRHHPPKVIEPR